MSRSSSKNIKADHYRPTCETPIEWRFAGGPIVVRDFIRWLGSLLQHGF